MSSWALVFCFLVAASGARFICTTNRRILGGLERIFIRVFLGAHASCVRGVRPPRHAGSVRSHGRLRGSLNGAACLLRLFDLGPAVAQTYGSIEDRLALGRIRIDREIPVPLELIKASRRCVSQAG